MSDDDNAGGVANRFKEFKNRVIDFLHVDPNSTKEPPYYEVIFDIFDGSDDYIIDFEEMRLTKDLLISAIFLAIWKNKSVIFLSPTSYYAAQAIPLVKACNAEKNMSVAVSTAIPNDVYNMADVIFHHGRDFRDKLPECAQNKRHIIQIFPDENVPHDPRSLRSLMCASHTE